MSPRNRFKQILKYFRLIENSLYFPPGHEKNNLCAKFESIVRHANRVFKLHCTPHKESSIDESLVGTLWHSSVIRYLRNKKHHRWDIKLCMLRDAVSRYCLTFHCYKCSKRETDSDKRKFGLGCDVVVNLLKESNCLNKGYHVLFDKFFSGVDFVRYLYFTESYLRGYSSVQIRKNPKLFFHISNA